MERGYAYLTLMLPDRRILHVGPSARISGHIPETGDAYAAVHRLACFVDALPNQPSGPASICRADGSVIGDLISVADAVALKPASGTAIINAARRLLSEANAHAHSISASTDPADILFYEWVARCAPAFREEIEQAEAAFYGPSAEMEQETEHEPFASFRIGNNRRLVIGPWTEIWGMGSDVDVVTMPVHALECAIVDNTGSQTVSLIDAAKAAPDIAVDIVAAARQLIDQTLDAVREVADSGEPEHAVFRTYVAENVKPFARTLKQVERQVLQAAHRQAERELG